MENSWNKLKKKPVKLRNKKRSYVVFEYIPANTVFVTFSYLNSRKSTEIAWLRCYKYELKQAIKLIKEKQSKFSKLSA